MVSTDAIFLKGSTHDVCQDYALAPSSSIVVCDGYSASPNVDVGARIIAHAIMKREPTELYHFDPVFVDTLETVRASLDLRPDAFDSTILYAYETKEAFGTENHIIVRIIGDGVVLVKYKNSQTEIYDYTYPQR